MKWSLFCLFCLSLMLILSFFNFFLIFFGSVKDMNCICVVGVSDVRCSKKAEKSGAINTSKADGFQV
jgi:hypothetical protein